MTTTTDKLAEALRGLAERHGYKASHPSAEVRGLLADDVRAALAAYDAERASVAREPAGAHTAEPWHVGPFDRIETRSSAGFMRRVICDMTHRPPHVVPAANDARRVVACVNACAGIPTETLERGDWWKVGANASAELRAQAVAVIARNSPHMTAAALLVHAYARGGAEGGSVDWDDVNRAWEAACVEVGPERVASIAALYADDEADA